MVGAARHLEGEPIRLIPEFAMFPDFQEGDMAQPRMMMRKVKQILRLDSQGG